MQVTRRALLAAAGAIGATGHVAGEDGTDPPGTLYGEKLYSEGLYAAGYNLDDEPDPPDDDDPDECFIATAAEGSKSHPHVERLRDFRDATLRRSAPGRAFITLYYATSPPVARWIGRSDRRRRVVSRVLVRPLARAVTAAQLYNRPDDTNNT